MTWNTADPQEGGTYFITTDGAQGRTVTYAHFSPAYGWSNWLGHIPRSKVLAHMPPPPPYRDPGDTKCDAVTRLARIARAIDAHWPSLEDLVDWTMDDTDQDPFILEVRAALHELPLQ